MTVKKSLFIAISTIFLQAHQVWAQLPDKVGSLITADRAAANVSRVESPHAALMSIVDKESVLYVPSIVNAVNYLKNRPNIPDVMTWQPNFALVSRSLDWGVTSGPFEFQKIGAIKRYGQYLSVWRRDKRGSWKLELRAEVENYGKNNSSDLTFYEPDDSWYLKHRSKVRLEQREEVVTQTDQLFSNVLRADNTAAFNEFLADDVRYYYPWKEEIEGKKNVLAFLKKERIEITTEPTGVGRAYSGEYAYTSGTATVTTKEKEMKFNYIRIWQLKNDYQWQVMIEMMFER
ncbi:nuclear transport factor 2 family protein [Sphingobacterium sp. UT-1RO-CII-1]|uniref:nuclear transport factor 2 family protein n=1 Tax=Sphingobacterium sp. UT-1RO-CII-1 TaxID=2995225 RepID=UPI00227C0632|nr:nuclear transport factor 2 family protein [Sphingobacterium sp. UT-1RO-CII-1]MCY4781607.1 nuclear transport factor 2 family protein [Sphingobacterium sp. UT-1RO-CII-1]